MALVRLQRAFTEGLLGSWSSGGSYNFHAQDPGKPSIATRSAAAQESKRPTGAFKPPALHLCLPHSPHHENVATTAGCPCGHPLPMSMLQDRHQTMTLLTHPRLYISFASFDVGELIVAEKSTENSSARLLRTHFA
eukprot:scaffold20631_cov22-Tisochrysis_lutea.AAC.1